MLQGSILVLYPLSGVISYRLRCQTTRSYRSSSFVSTCEAYLEPGDSQPGEKSLVPNLHIFADR